MSRTPVPLPHSLGRLASVLSVRYGLVLGFDGIATAVALLLALFLRFDWSPPTEYMSRTLSLLPVLVAIRIVLSLAFGLHRWSFRMSGLSEAVRVPITTFAGTACFLFVQFFVHGPGLPRSVVVMEFFMTSTAMAALRFVPRLAMNWYADRRRGHLEGSARTIIVGAGHVGDLLLRDLLRSPNPHAVIGFVDDDPRKIGTSLGGKPVLGAIDGLPDLIKRHDVSKILMAIPGLPAERIRSILTLCAQSKVSFKIIPGAFTSLGTDVATMLKDLAPEDLLPRDSVVFDHDEIRGLVQGRRVLVTGAAGSIGGEIAVQVAGYGARRLVLVDINENELYFLYRRLQEKYPRLEIHAEVADIRDAARLSRLGEKYRPQDVFHAAAHKHVPLLEEAPDEAIKNNVFGTLNAARMAVEWRAERFVFISTDKAVRPSSIMGASKRLAELVVRDLARSGPTHFSVVRFGNVLGSAGSVVPLFKEQIARGGPVTVTHPDCTRYFMTIPEAVGLVLIAGLGDYGELCILDMGQAIRIADLAAHLITMAGRLPGVDIPIVFTGLRPGEKIAEELLTEEEEQSRLVRNKVLVAKCPPTPENLAARLDEMEIALRSSKTDDMLRILRDLVPSYRPRGEPDLSASNVVPLRRSSGSIRVTPRS